MEYKSLTQGECAAEHLSVEKGLNGARKRVIGKINAKHNPFDLLNVT